MSIYDNNCSPKTESCSEHNISCCEICKCLNVYSSNNTVVVEKDGCKIDLKIDTLSLSNSFKINDGKCISFTKDYVNNVLIYTPVLNMECIAAIVCGMCAPPTPIACPKQTNLIIS